jgi:hypothetical protein
MSIFIFLVILSVFLPEAGGVRLPGRAVPGISANTGRAMGVVLDIADLLRGE